MYYLKTFLFSLLLLFAQNLHAQKRFTFRNGKFKIVQFTDIHWNPVSPKCDSTRAVIWAILTREKPDIAILTGDIVTEKPYDKGWNDIISIFEQARMPFVVTMGNHDAEHITREEIYHRLFASPFYAGLPDPVGVSGGGNCAIPVFPSGKSATNPQAVLYCIDSNDYQPDKELGEYDWIHFDQITWYRNTSKAFTQRHQGKPLPALAFFHIPLPEYNHVLARGDYQGQYKDDGIWAPRINSGMFGSFIDQKDVMGVFTGHDHQNDFIGLERGIALGYGRVTGFDAYGALQPGGRIIELYEGQRKFDTWIATAQSSEDYFYYPSGLSSKDEHALPVLPALPVKPARQGIAYTYYEGNIAQTADIAQATKVSEGTLPNFSISSARIPDHFGFIFRALIRIPQSGVYRFYTFSDDGSRLFIDGREIVNNDGGHSARRAEGKVALEAGFHQIEVPYFENYMGEFLEVGYSSRHLTEQPIPNEALFLP